MYTANRPTTIERLGAIENTILDLITFLISDLEIPSSIQCVYAFILNIRVKSLRYREVL